MPKPRGRKDFVFIETGIRRHPKLKAIKDPKAGWLWLCGTCYAGEYKTDGHVPRRDIEREAGVTSRITEKLSDVGLWHLPGHDCPRCPQPDEGSIYIHDFLEHQPSRVERDKAREDAEAAASARWGKPRRDAEGNAKGIARTHAKGIPTSNAEAEIEIENSLLTFISRLAASDAGRKAPPPAEVIDEWQGIAGAGVDLNAEAKAYLAWFGDRPAKNERGAWLGWLRKAALRAAEAHELASVDPDADIRPPEGCGHPGCMDGWVGDDDQGRPIRCPKCRPRLRSAS